MAENKLLYAELTHRIIGAAMEVHNILGPGFLEAVYEGALAHEFSLRSIAYERQKALQVAYKAVVADLYRADFIVEDKVSVDTKAVKQLTEMDEAQIINYLKVTKLRVGLVINFAALRLEYKRWIL
ncbi:MAG TPA: GxxExxY protein [Anaerolineae bacterium]|nr:GxxExxY protein [Anaerolineae bacterium]